MLMRLDRKVELTARARVTLVASQDVQYNTGSKLDSVVEGQQAANGCSKRQIISKLGEQH